MHRTAPFSTARGTRFLVAATLAIGLGGHAAAQSGALPETSPAGPPISEGGALSVTVENDLVADTDRDYTSGVRLDYITPRNQLSPFGDVAKRQLNPWLKAEDWYEIYAVGQTIFTPTDISAPPARGDRPYAGFLYGSFGVAADSGDQLNTVVLDVGVVGPLSGAEQTQKYVHDIIDAAKPVGWDLQLENEPAFRVLYEHKRRAFLDLSLPFFDLGVDMLPHANVSLGTLDISAGAGVTLRLGAGLLDDYGPPRVRPAVGAPGFFSTNRFFRWYLFAGAEGRAVGRNLLLEGNTFGGRDGVTINPFVGDFQVGAAAGLGAVELSYTHVLRTEEYAAQPGFAEFGSFNIRTKF